MPRGEYDPCRRPNGDGATAADTIAELGCGRPLPRAPRVSCDPPGHGSGWWLRLCACRYCCLVAAAQRGGSLPCSLWTVLCRTVQTAFGLIAHLRGLRDGRRPPFHCPAVPCWQPRRVGASMQKARKDRSPPIGVSKSSRAFLRMVRSKRGYILFLNIFPVNIRLPQGKKTQKVRLPPYTEQTESFPRLELIVHAF